MRKRVGRNVGIIVLLLILTIACTVIFEQNRDTLRELSRGVFSVAKTEGSGAGNGESGSQNGENEAGDGESGSKNIESGSEAGTGESDLLSLLPKGEDRLVIWYTKESMSDYFTELAVNYQKEYGVSVYPMLRSGVDFMEQLNDAQKAGEAPDLYLTDNSNLEKAFLSGYAARVSDPDRILTTEHYPQTALNAVTCSNSPVAWPLSFETTFFVYNHSYLQEFAKNQIEAERAQEAADAAEGEAPADTESASEEEIAAKIKEYLPTKISDIETFAESYDPPSQVESIFLWDISDVFYNYFILGDCINLAGPCGDDESQLTVKGANSKAALDEYKSLLDFFSLKDESKPYSLIRDDFAEGKMVYTIASTDILKQLAENSRTDVFPWEYKVGTIPDIGDGIASRGLSVTSCLCVNGYGENQDAAMKFAAWISQKSGELLYQRTGQLSACLDTSYDDPHIAGALEAYEASVPMCKLMTKSDIWMQIENAYIQIENGADVSMVLQKLDAAVK